MARLFRGKLLAGLRGAHRRAKLRLPDGLDLFQVVRVWRKWLSRRSQDTRVTWERMTRLLVEFGRFAAKHAPKAGRRRPETIYFVGFTLYRTQNRRGGFKVGIRTERSRVHRALAKLRDLMQRMRHLPVREQALNLNHILRGHYAYFGGTGNIRALERVARAVERYWRKMLSSRSRTGDIPWDVLHRIKTTYPLQPPRLRLPYRELQALAVP